MAFFKQFKGEEVNALGQVNVLDKSFTRSKINVNELLLEDGTCGIGLNIVTKGFLSYSSFPISMNEEQARDLVVKINKALGDK